MRFALVGFDPEPVETSQITSRPPFAHPSRRPRPWLDFHSTLPAAHRPIRMIPARQKFWPAKPGAAARHSGAGRGKACPGPARKRFARFTNSFGVFQLFWVFIDGPVANKKGFEAAPGNGAWHWRQCKIRLCVVKRTI